MIKLITGKEGSGKSKLLINTANESIKKAKGYIIFIDYDNSHMFQIDYRGRFVGVKDYGFNDDVGFYGFLCGIIASNYDIEAIYIDSLEKITGKEVQDLEPFFSKLDVLEMKYNVSFIFTLSLVKEELPDFLSKYSVEEVSEK